jgi:hypothetical protein
MATLPKTLPKLTTHSIPDPQLRVPSVRLTPDNTSVLENLGLLANLAGTWKGTGFNLVARPDKEQNTNLYLELNQTRETLVFTPISSAIPNRGFGMDDIELFGLTYLQQITDSVTGGALHIEPGIWVRQPATTDPVDTPPKDDDIVFRMGSIPHGNAILAKGLASKFTGPPTLPTETAAYNGSVFPSFNSTPFPAPVPAPAPAPTPAPGPIFAPGTAEFNLPPPPPPAPAHGFTQYTITNPAGTLPDGTLNTRTPFGNVPAIPLPSEINGVLIQDLVNDPITLLQEVVAQQQVDGFTFEGVALNITSQTPILFGTTPNQAAPTVSVAVPDGGGGIENIPFLQNNADSALVYATFWITTVSHPKRKESFLQLQYAQMVLLNFPILAAGPKSPVLSWPHITVGTLTRDFG